MIVSGIIRNHTNGWPPAKAKVNNQNQKKFHKKNTANIHITIKVDSIKIRSLFIRVISGSESDIGWKLIVHSGTINFLGSKPVDGNFLPHILALWSEKLSIEKNHESEMQK